MEDVGKGLAASLIDDWHEPVDEVLVALFDDSRNGLTEGEIRFRQVVEAAPDAMVLHQAGRVLYANPAAIERFGARDLAHLQHYNLAEFILEPDRTAIMEALAELDRSDAKTQIIGYRCATLQGDIREIETVAVKVPWENGTAILNICRDMTDRNRTMAALKESEARYYNLITYSPEAIVAICDRQIVVANDAAARLLDASSPSELIGTSLSRIYDEEAADEIARRIAAVAGGEIAATTRSDRMYRLDGIAIEVECTWIPLTYDRRPAAYALIKDVTDQRASEEHHRFLASHDPLTQLPNRYDFHQRMRAALRMGKRFAVYYLDLDCFKSINDTLGHSVGDHLLEMVAERLRGAVAEGDVVARLGGDEFAVLQVGVFGAVDARHMAEKLQAALGQSYSVCGHRLQASATVGIALSPDHGNDPEGLLRKADFALYEAKARGRNVIGFFGDEMEARLQKCDFLTAELARTEAQSEFEVHFQPIIALASNRVSGVEALLRWRQRGQGLVGASEFIQELEASCGGQQVMGWVLEEACKRARYLQLQGLNDFRMAVNVSMSLLQQPDLIQVVSKALGRADLEPSVLEIEITEHTIMSAGVSGILPKLSELRRLGVRIALDDFGTGYSSLTLIKELPVDRIKIDRSFVGGVGVNEQDTAIAKAVLLLGQSLGVGVTAEGVADQATWEWLKHEGCDDAQGFYLARPMPMPDLLAYLERKEGLVSPMVGG